MGKSPSGGLKITVLNVYLASDDLSQDRVPARGVDLGEHGEFSSEHLGLRVWGSSP